MMIYLDTSVLLAHLLADDKTPPDRLWMETLVSSRLLQFEIWNRLHALKLEASHGDVTKQVLGRVAFLELISPVLERALEPFPMALRTLDALHLATIDFLQKHLQTVKLASYDERLLKAARSMKIPLYALD